MNRIEIPPFSKGKFFRVLGVTRNVAPRNIQPSYCAKVKGMSSRVIKTAKQKSIFMSFFYALLPFCLPSHVLQLEHSPPWHLGSKWETLNVVGLSPRMVAE